MNIGFDTIGNAILICYDMGMPVLATDPWISGSAYFGSWGLSHEIPREQMEGIAAAKHIWISHGHPDHLHGESLQQLKDKQLLIPDHVGNRIFNSLTEQGYHVKVLQSYYWYDLSDNIRIMNIADHNQDAILLVDINRRLLVNCNDANDRGWGPTVRRVAKDYPISFLLALSGHYGDANMINFLDERGRQIVPTRRTPSLGIRNAQRTENLGCRYFVPFSSMHKYQRTDSIWANAYRTELGDYSKDFASKTAECLPPFIRYDCEHDQVTALAPEETPETVMVPGDFEDNWNDEPTAKDSAAIQQYFSAVQHVTDTIDFIDVKMGRYTVGIAWTRKGMGHRGVTFHAPRHSFMEAIKHEIFDDLLIANFMTTTLHGDWASGLYPDFTPYVAKYADNGRAKTNAEVEKYFQAYKYQQRFRVLGLFELLRRK